MRDDQPTHGTYAAAFQAEVDRLEQMRGEESLTQLQRIIDLAIQHNDPAAVLEWRCTLIQAASHFGRSDVKIGAFQSLCAMYDAEPDAEDLRAQVLWFWKWLTEDLPEFIDVPVQQLNALHEQMRQFYEREAESPAPVLALRYRAAAFMGQGAAAARHLKEWDACEQGESDDCAACQINMRVESLLDLDHIDAALAAAEPLIRGEHSCEDVPATTFSRLLLPLLFRGEGEVATSMMRVFRRQVRHTPSMLDHLADHLLMLSLVPSPQTARRHACVLCRRIAETTNSYARFCCARALWVWATRRGSAGLPLALPRRSLEALPCEQDDASVSTWLESEMRRLAAAFDERNGSDRFSGLVQSAEDLLTFDIDSISGR